MNKIIYLDGYKEKIRDIEKLKKIQLTREERLEANKSLLIDDDELILKMILEETFIL